MENQHSDFFWTDELVKRFANWRDTLSYPIYNPIGEFKRLYQIEKVTETFSREPKKDYEILECWDAGGYHCFNYHRFNKFCLSNGCKISSVKRLSDGEVFSVGDVIKVYRQTGYKGERAITGFSVVDDELVVEHNGCKSSLYQIAKSKKSLFTTEDGVHIFEGNEYWFIKTDDIKEKVISIYKCTHADHYYDGNYKKFSTKEAAEEYILLNKPVLSVNDVIDQPCGFTMDLPKILKELAKSRICTQ